MCLRPPGGVDVAVEVATCAYEAKGSRKPARMIPITIFFMILLINAYNFQLLHPDSGRNGLVYFLNHKKIMMSTKARKRSFAVALLSGIKSYVPGW